MWRERYAVAPALNFLKTPTYARVDPALWDGNLWFYGELERGPGEYIGCPLCDPRSP